MYYLAIHIKQCHKKLLKTHPSLQSSSSFDIDWIRQARLNRGSGEEDGVEADHCEVRDVPRGECSSSKLASIWRLERTGLELLSTDADLNGD